MSLLITQWHRVHDLLVPIEFKIGSSQVKHTLGMCYHITNVFAFGLSILAFEISTIMHQQLVTVLQGHMGFMYV